MSRKHLMILLKRLRTKSRLYFTDYKLWALHFVRFGKERDPVRDKWHMPQKRKL